MLPPVKFSVIGPFAELSAGGFTIALNQIVSPLGIAVPLKFDDKLIGKNELPVLLTELKADIAKYLKSSPAPIPARTLAGLIAFDQAHEKQEMALFGQELFVQADKTKGLSDPKYKKARSVSSEGISAMNRLGAPHVRDPNTLRVRA